MIKSLINYIPTLVLVLAMCNTSKAVIFRSIQNGDWTAKSTWSQDKVTPASRTPQGGDTIFIDAGFTIDVTSNLNFTSQAPLYVEVAGSLEFIGGGSKLRTSAGSGVKVVIGGSIVPSGSGGGSSKTIEIGGVTLWKSSDGIINTPTDYGTTPTSALPVEALIVFAEINDNVPVIYWKVINPKNVSYYEVLRSYDLELWEKIIEIDAYDEDHYDVTDEEARSGSIYYKIIAVDFDQSKSSSEIVSTFLDTHIKVNIYPNPASDVLYIDLKNISHEDIEIHNNGGRKMDCNYQIQGDKMILDIRNYTSGNYFISLSDEFEGKSYHFVKK